MAAHVVQYNYRVTVVGFFGIGIYAEKRLARSLQPNRASHGQLPLNVFGVILFSALVAGSSRQCRRQKEYCERRPEAQGG